MDFIKKHKTIVILSLLGLIILGVSVWMYKRNSADTTATVPNSVPSGDSELKAKILKKMNEIKAYPEWYNSIQKDYAKQGMTLTQAVANAAIWGLKVDGMIPMDTYGAGEWGHTDWVKANY